MKIIEVDEGHDPSLRNDPNKLRLNRNSTLTNPLVASVEKGL